MFLYGSRQNYNPNNEIRLSSEISTQVEVTEIKKSKNMRTKFVRYKETTIPNGRNEVGKKIAQPNLKILAKLFECNIQQRKFSFGV